MCSHQESNLDRRYRKPAFYPLNYESVYMYIVSYVVQFRTISSGLLTARFTNAVQVVDIFVRILQKYHTTSQIVSQNI